MHEPEPLRGALERFFRHLGTPPINTVTELASAWPEIVGPVLAENSHPIKLVDGVLTVHCDDSAWASQIRWMDAQIKDGFARLFPDAIVRSVRVTQR